jgi:arsenate reductase
LRLVSPGQIRLELLEDAAATVAGLFAIILTFGPISGGHSNLMVSFVDAAFSGLSRRDAAEYLPAQLARYTAEAVLANLMFALPAVTHLRQAPGHACALPVGDRGHGRAAAGDLRAGPVRPYPLGPGRGWCLHRRGVQVHSPVSFTNPAITIGQMLSDTFAGIAPSASAIALASTILKSILVTYYRYVSFNYGVTRN